MSEVLEDRIVLSSINLVGTQVRFNAVAGESNNLTVTESAGTLTFTDSGAAITPTGGPFAIINANEVTISTASVTSLNITLGDMNDNLDASGVGAGVGITSSFLNGGDGNDVLVGTQINDSFSIQGMNVGADMIDGRGGRDGLFMSVDHDITMTDSALQIGTFAGTHTDIEVLNITGGVSDNVIDLSGITATSGFDFIVMNGAGGDDTLIGSQLPDNFALFGEGADTIDGQAHSGGAGDSLFITADQDITMSDSALQIGASIGSHTNIERINITGGASDNVIDLSAITTASSFNFIQMNGAGGDDTMIGSQIGDRFVVNGLNQGQDTIDGQAQDATPNNILITADADLSLDDGMFSIASVVSTYTDIERINLTGGAGDNILDASLLTAASGLTEVSMLVDTGNDTVIPGDFGVSYSIVGLTGFDTLDLRAAAVSPNVNITGPGTVDGNKGLFGGTSTFNDIDEIILPPEYDFSAATYSTAEGDATNSTTVVEVTRSVNTSIASSVNVVLTSGTATVGSDFTAGPITVNFLAGEVSKTVSIELLGDTNVEADETILLSLADGIAGAANPNATLTVLNDDVSNQSPELLTAATDATFADKARPGDSVALSATFTDPDVSDTHTAVIDWGDGTTSVGVVDGLAGTISGSHNYATGGLFDVTVTITDGAGAIDVIATTAVVSGVRLTLSGELQVIGTDHHDHIAIREGQGSQAGTLRVHTHHQHSWWHHGHGHQIDSFNLNDVSSIVVHTCEGNDHVHINSNVSLSATVHAGAGHDHIHGGSGDDVLLGGSGWDWIDGGRGSDVIVGGSGWDWLAGGRGNDVIIGGTGRDSLFGGKDEDLLIGGWTDHDDDLTALNQIYSEWNSGDSFATRISNLSSGLLSLSRIHDDDVRDWMKGGQHRDWYIGDFFGSDKDKVFGFDTDEDQSTHVP